MAPRKKRRAVQRAWKSKQKQKPARKSAPRQPATSARKQRAGKQGSMGQRRAGGESRKRQNKTARKVGTGAERKPARRPAATVKPKKTKRLTGKARQLSERSRRGAATRKSKHKRITSRTKRRTVGTLEYKGMGFGSWGDVVRGTNPARPEVREKLDAMLEGLIGQDVGLTFYVEIEDEDGNIVRKRVRRVVRGLRGRDDIADLAGSVTRAGYVGGKDELEGKFNAVTITSVSVQQLDAGEDDDFIAGEDDEDEHGEDDDLAGVPF